MKRRNIDGPALSFSGGKCRLTCVWRIADSGKISHSPHTASVKRRDIIDSRLHGFAPNSLGLVVESPIALFRCEHK
jgi:hypothetical protein